ncbi:MAG: DUF4269 domain-containing protein [Acidobacteria bacterium]|nr:DUF4269 domain-containing protein [Acidobacteriota bacterium]
MNWQIIDYLKNGTSQQRQAWTTLRRLGLPERLARYHATLVSTVCVGLDIESSDLDIICQVEEDQSFETTLRRFFGRQPGFRFHCRSAERREWVARFRTTGFPVEIFSAPIAVTRQNAYRHLTVMWRLLHLGGEPLRQAVRDLKHAGFKTEPAFVRLLGLAGEPYQAFLRLEEQTDGELADLLEKWRLKSG